MSAAHMLMRPLTPHASRLTPHAEVMAGGGSLGETAKLESLLFRRLKETALQPNNTHFSRHCYMLRHVVFHKSACIRAGTGAKKANGETQHTHTHTHTHKHTDPISRFLSLSESHFHFLLSLSLPLSSSSLTFPLCLSIPLSFFSLSLVDF